MEGEETCENWSSPIVYILATQLFSVLFATIGQKTNEHCEFIPILATESNEISRKVWVLMLNFIFQLLFFVWGISVLHDYFTITDGLDLNCDNEKVKILLCSIMIGNNIFDLCHASFHSNFCSWTQHIILVIYLYPFLQPTKIWNVEVIEISKYWQGAFILLMTGLNFSFIISLARIHYHCNHSLGHKKCAIVICFLVSFLISITSLLSLTYFLYFIDHFTIFARYFGFVTFTIILIIQCFYFYTYISIYRNLKIEIEKLTQNYQSFMDTQPGLKIF